MKDAKTDVLKQLLALARLIRRKGTPDEAAAVLPYERQLESDLAAAQASTPVIPALSAQPQPVAA